MLTTLAPLFLNFIIAVGNTLLQDETPLIQAIGQSMIDLGKNALAALIDTTTPLAQKELEWKQDKDIVLAVVAKGEDQVPSLVTTLISTLEQLAFSSLLVNL